MVASLHRKMKERLAQLSLNKLAYIEKGLLDAWEHEFTGTTHYVTALEQAIEAHSPAPQLPAWMPTATE